MKQENPFAFQISIPYGFSMMTKIFWILVCLFLSLNLSANSSVGKSNGLKIPKQILLFEKNKGNLISQSYLKPWTNRLIMNS